MVSGGNVRMASLPAGTVTFLFTDIEGSTTLLQRLGDRRYAEVLEEHRRLLRAAFEEGRGQEVDTQGDAFLVAFSRARNAVRAAVAAQRALTKHAWPDGRSLKVRMALHTGEPVNQTRGYVGLDVHRAARICSVGHGGQTLLSQTVADLAAPDLPPGVSLQDLGTHRLKDLKEPEHLFQVLHPDLPADFPPLKSLNARPNNLPIQLTSFVGRAREIAQIKGLLGEARLVTLTGSGGAGKTRLALQVGAEIVEAYPDGVWLAELAPIADPALVQKTVASALNVREQPGRDMTETLVDALRPRVLLLILDNCEHLLAAIAELAHALLRECPTLRILGTSRVPLSVPGEMLWRVPSLSLPDPGRLPPLDHVQQYEAMRLFAERARSVDPAFALTSDNARVVAEVCQRLDGIPLAIELAAARTRILAVEQIAARLHDRFRLLTGGIPSALPRHQTLRATMDWSYGLLAEIERVLLRRLSVFAGGWTLEAAEVICSGDGVESANVLDLLARLADNSLVVVETQHGETRYRLLETVKQYGQDRLHEAGEAAAVRRRHRDWYLELGEQADVKLRGLEEDVWLKRLETEHDNIRVAMQWSKADAGGAEAELRFARALEWFWYLLGHWSEGRARLEEALARSTDASPSTLSKVFIGAARLAYRQGDRARTQALCEKGLALCRELGDKGGIAKFLIWLGIVALAEADYKRAAPLLENSLALCREIGDKWWAVEALALLGALAAMQGHYERAAALHLESLAVSRQTGSTHNITTALRNLGYLALRQGDYARAASCFMESLSLCREVRTPGVITECLEGLARAACARAEYNQAARLFGAVEGLFEALGGQLPFYEFDRSDHDRCMISTQVELGAAVFAATWAEGRAMTLEQAIEYALTDRPDVTTP